MSWEDSFVDAKEANPDLKFVKPAWLLRCQLEQKKVEEARFQVEKD